VTYDINAQRTKGQQLTTTAATTTMLETVTDHNDGIVKSIHVNDVAAAHSTNWRHSINAHITNRMLQLYSHSTMPLIVNYTVPPVATATWDVCCQQKQRAGSQPLPGNLLTNTWCAVQWL